MKITQSIEQFYSIDLMTANRELHIHWVGERVSNTVSSTATCDTVNDTVNDTVFELIKATPKITAEEIRGKAEYLDRYGQTQDQSAE
ncbi:MAG: hypothetical protein LBM63_04970 [Rikenellaceae bacterium]|nr:hypothetical protein [Rikenellaceae bacterium]